MGNTNSTRWNTHNKKRTVEQSLDFRMKTIHPNLIPGTAGVLSWKWKGQVFASAGFSVLGQGKIPSHIHLVYRFRGQPMSQEIELTTTLLSWGSIRYWFKCPNEECGRRVTVLYSPPGGNGYFYCRQCYNLTYTSCQESERGGRAFNQLAAVMQDRHPGIKVEDIRRLMKSEIANRKKLSKSKKYARFLQKIMHKPRDD